jgi:hypothetical protein
VPFLPACPPPARGGILMSPDVGPSDSQARRSSNCKRVTDRTSKVSHADGLSGRRENVACRHVVDLPRRLTDNRPATLEQESWPREELP